MTLLRKFNKSDWQTSVSPWLVHVHKVTITIIKLLKQEI